MAISSIIYKSLLYTCAIAYIILYQSPVRVKIGSNIIMLMLFSLTLLFLSIDILKSVGDTISPTTILYYILPLLAILLSILFLLYILINNFDRIANDQLSSDFFNFKNLSLFLIFFQLLIIVMEMQKKGELTKFTNSIINLFSVINIWLLILMYDNVKYFTANG